MTFKKTPKNKGTVDANEKMLDMVMSTLTSVTEKLAAMDKRITGLASRIESTPAKSARKFRLREQTKRREVSDPHKPQWTLLKVKRKGELCHSHRVN